MKPLSRVAERIARDVVDGVFTDTVLLSHPLWAHALEIELSAVLRAYVAEDEQLDSEAMEALLQRAEHTREELARLKHDLAQARGFPLGDAGVARMVDAMARLVVASPLGFSGAADHLLRRSIFAVIRKHLGFARGRRPVVTPDLSGRPELIRAIRLLQLPRLELLEAIREELETNPFLERREESVDGAAADVFVRKLGEHYAVVLNGDGLSSLRISRNYRADVRNALARSSKVKGFIQEKLRSAHWLLRSIHMRRMTIQLVTESIVRFEREFLDHGVDRLRPLTLSDVAEDIGMHAATVSRATDAKSVDTPQGTFELRYFFNSAIVRVAGDDIGSDALKSHIEQLVSTEDVRNPHPDEKLVELLRVRGIDIAGRAVARYREALGIPPAHRRQRPR